MKYFYPFLILTLTSVILTSQDLQVTNMQGFSVEDPKFSISENNVYLTFATNMRVYKFSVNGPSSPISDPLNPDPYQWGPFQVDIASFGNYVYLIYTDYLLPNFGIKVAFSNNQGIDWYQLLVDTINIGYSLPKRYDLPKVVVSDKGNVYMFYFVFQNNTDTAGIYMFNLFSNERKKIDTFFPRARYEYAITPFVKTINNVDNIFISYWIDSSFYLIKSTDEGITFSSPRIIQNVDVLWPFYDWQSTFLYSQDGKLYFKYDYQKFDFGEHQRKFFIKVSEDLGQTWSNPILIDTNYNYVDVRLVGNKIVKFFNDSDMNLYIQWSSDLINWSPKIRVNTVDSSVNSFYPTAQEYNNKLAIAWKDRRTSNDEIFYRLMDISTLVENSLTPEGFTLQQNFPNPFNPVTYIPFTLNNRLKVSLRVYDLFGRLIKTLVDEEMEAGTYNIQFNGKGLSSGVYYYELISDKTKLTKKMLLLK